MDKGESGMVGKRRGNHPKLSQFIVALPCNQIYMIGESKLRIKHDTEVAHTSREGYVRAIGGYPVSLLVHALLIIYIIFQTD